MVRESQENPCKYFKSVQVIYFKLLLVLLDTTFLFGDLYKELKAKIFSNNPSNLIEYITYFKAHGTLKVK